MKKTQSTKGKSPKTSSQKKFAALAPPKNKITFADKIAGAKKMKTGGSVGTSKLKKYELAGEVQDKDKGKKGKVVTPATNSAGSFAKNIKGIIERGKSQQSDFNNAKRILKSGDETKYDSLGYYYERLSPELQQKLPEKKRGGIVGKSKKK